MTPETRITLLDAIDDMAACLRRMREAIDRDVSDDDDDDEILIKPGGFANTISDSALRALVRSYDPLAGTEGK